jgi:effector-binding domain-containing protein
MEAPMETPDNVVRREGAFDMAYDIIQHDLRPQPVISIRERLDQEHLPAFFGRALGNLYAHLGRHGVPPRGEPFVIYHAFGPEGIDAEVCIPVPTALPVTEPIAYRELPAATVVETLHVGPYEELSLAYGALVGWIEDHGFQVAGPFRERYLNEPGPGVAPATYRTIVQIPIEPVAVLVS